MDQFPVQMPGPAQSEISLFDRSDERSVVRLVPLAVSNYFEDHIAARPDLFAVDERDLYQTLRKEQKQPTPTDNRLRLKFWDEYDRCQSMGKGSMQMASVIAGICSKQFFYDRYLKTAEKVAWLLCPPTGYLTKAEEALEFGIEQIRDILDQPHVVGGKVDTKLGDLKAKIVMMLDVRVKGAVMTKNVNMNLNATTKQVANAATAVSAEDLMRQLKDIEALNRKAQNLPQPAIDGGKPDIDIS